MYVYIYTHTHTYQRTDTHARNLHAKYKKVTTDIVPWQARPRGVLANSVHRAPQIHPFPQPHALQASMCHNLSKKKNQTPQVLGFLTTDSCQLSAFGRHFSLEYRGIVFKGTPTDMYMDKFCKDVVHSYAYAVLMWCTVMRMLTLVLTLVFAIKWPHC